MESSCFLDFCLRCDRQTPPGAGNYCSERCRLADLDHSSRMSQPSSSEIHTARRTPTNRSNQGLSLQPAFDFKIWRAYMLGQDTPDSSNPASPLHYQSGLLIRPLATSSSHCSMDSLESVESSNSTISESAKIELRAYANSFDKMRCWKRRLSTRH